MAPSPVAGITNGSWDNAAVVFDTIVPSQRPVVGGRKNYEIDVREFVVTENNAVIRRTLEKDIALFATLELDAAHGRERLRERGPGCFDFRARAIIGWVLRNVRYEAKRGVDPWQFPDETLTVLSGDCEDIAFLVASLLLASGVSGYHVRVALGYVEDGNGKRHDHAWVLYKSEAGRWRLIEPLAVRHGGVRPPRVQRVQTKPAAQEAHYSGSLSYQASYLFNADHLWAIPHHGHPGSFARIAGREWRRMNPKFAGDVHRRVVESALEDIAPPELMSYLRGRFRNVVVATVDESDWIDPTQPSSTPYNPLDHFDNGCIDESWRLVESRLASFTDSGQEDHEKFAQAIHGIADFYAHSSYLAFGWVTGSPVRAARPYPGKSVLDADQENTYLHDSPFYGSPADPNVDFDFNLHRFSANRALWRGTTDAAIASWDGKLVSGRYAQSKEDAMGSLTDRTLEQLCQLPPQFATPERGALPHHDEIAVDSADRSDAHRLFRDVATYRQQFEWRVDSAVRHVREAYLNGKPY